MYPRRPRLQTFSYTGLYRYFLTICTAGRRALFVDADLVGAVLLQIRRAAAEHAFSLPAYCFMPDHLHLVVEATSAASNLRRFVSDWKQRTGHSYRRQVGRPLWQPSYYDRVLRSDEDTLRVARYVLANPVRAGLVSEPAEYAYGGSDVFPVCEVWQG